MSRRMVSLLGSVCVLASLLGVAIAQDAVKEAKPSTKVRGRLPAYYKDVVTEDQKQKIYTIQQKYNDQIRKLAEEMKALTAQRDQEVEGVLSPDQKAKVETLRADAAKKKAPAKTSDAPDPVSESKTTDAKTTAVPAGK